MKNQKILSLGVLLLCVIFLACSGCRSVETAGSTENTTEESSYDPNPMERQGLAFSRMLCSPLNLLGFTVAECENIGSASIILFPFICCWTIPAGAIAMTGDIITGTTEMLFWQQFKTVRYPWDSFNYEAAKPYCDFTKILFLAALAGAAEGTAQGTADAVVASNTDHSPSYTPAPSGNCSRRQSRSSSSYTRSSGPCRICRGKGYLGNDPNNSRLRCRGCGGSGRQ